MSEKKTYSREFRLEAIRLSVTSGKSIAPLAKELVFFNVPHEHAYR